MIWKAARYLEELGILGMNRRNAEYIMRFNPRSAFPRVDDKVLTKQLAVEHQIPPRLSTISSNTMGIWPALKRPFQAIINLS